MRRTWLAVLVLGLFVAMGQSAEAKSHKHKHPKGVVITHVDQQERTVVLTIESSHSSLSYSLPTSATITVDQSPAAIGQLHTGMHVISYTEADEHVLSQIDVEATK